MLSAVRIRLGGVGIGEMFFINIQVEQSAMVISSTALWLFCRIFKPNLLALFASAQQASKKFSSVY